mmetsp:Transcript_43503/g.52735  ORF Transcript_43503/g.52735 Transcript_43503/m.52735 type:complete len:157 (-) Transcript_43503:98-568(-)
MVTDSNTVEIIKRTWSSITTTPEQRELVAERLMLNYLRVIPSARYCFPVISDEGILDTGMYLVTCIDRVMKLLENQNDPRLKAVLRSYGRFLLRFHIDPSYYHNAWFVLIETLQDILEGEFTELLLFYWIDIMDPLNTMMRGGILPNGRQVYEISD